MMASVTSLTSHHYTTEKFLCYQYQLSKSKSSVEPQVPAINQASPAKLSPGTIAVEPCPTNPHLTQGATQVTQNPIIQLSADLPPTCPAATPINTVATPTTLLSSPTANGPHQKGASATLNNITIALKPVLFYLYYICLYYSHLLLSLC